MKLLFIILTGQLLLLLVNGHDTTDEEKRVVCYFTGLDNERIVFLPEYIDPNLCTHLIYYNGKIHTRTWEVGPIYSDVAYFENGGQGFYNKTAMLKKNNPKLKVLLHVLSTESAHQVPRTSPERSNFTKSAVELLQKYGFDGLDIGWFTSGEGDKRPFTLLLSELRDEFDKHGFLISTLIPDVDVGTYDDNDIAVIKRCCDFMMVRTCPEMQYWNVTRIIGYLPLIKSTANYYLAKNVDPHKLVITVFSCGVALQLKNSNETGIGAAAYDPEHNQKFPHDGPIYYPEVLRMKEVQQDNWQIHRDEVSNASYATSKSGLWLTYEDESSLRAKAQYVIESKFGGMAIFSLDMDDFQGVAGHGRFPLTRVLYDAIIGGERNADTR